MNEPSQRDTSPTPSPRRRIPIVRKVLPDAALPTECDLVMKGGITSGIVYPRAIAEFARRHLERGADWGRIISLTTGGAPGFPEEVSYGASKNALESYTTAAAWELGRYGVTANVLCPPATDTGWITAEMAAEMARAAPLYHVGQPGDAAEVVLFLASHQARYITGQRITMR